MRKTANVTLDNLVFEHANWLYPDGDHGYVGYHPPKLRIPKHHGNELCLVEGTQCMRQRDITALVHARQNR